MRSFLTVALSSLACAAVAGLAGAGCTVVTSDTPVDGGDVGVDTMVDDTATTDTGTPEVATDAAAPAVIIPAASLLGGAGDDVRDFGGGSTRKDIVDDARIAYAIAKYDASGTVKESNVIGKDATGKLVDGRLEGLPAGSPITLKVTGYLRGLNGDADAAPTVRVPWAETTCTATPSATADVTATCTKLQLITGLKGILFSSDVLPAGYCAGKGATDFDRLRARSPYSGAAVVSKTTDDCYGVIWVPDTELSGASPSEWSLSLESKSSSTACTLMSPCNVDKMGNDVWVVGASCQLNATTAPGGCF